MRTHKIIFTCNSEEAAKWYEEEILHVEFCDLTHWYCGLDKEGEDTPETCIIYRGIVHPEIITVEVDGTNVISKDKDGSLFVIGINLCPRSFTINGKEYTVLSVKVEELDSFIELKKIREKIALEIWPNKHGIK